MLTLSLTVAPVDKAREPARSCYGGDLTTAETAGGGCRIVDAAVRCNDSRFEQLFVDESELD